ncbi:MAG TPA: hypothetical protein VGO68_03695 [Pyrinomonadaceae bacterium]|jgi:hypothetical protein|nr:hypothetical protein [Pyrinomonadaceae bacterium]
MKRSSAIAGCLILLLTLTTLGFGAPQVDEVNGPETFIKATRFLEQKPLDKDAKKLRSLAMAWLIVTDKVNVKTCSLLLSVDKKYKYSSELFSQYTFGMAAYKLANPDKGQDEDAVQEAGVESAMTSYEAIVAAQPKAKNAFMDELLAKRSQGSLAAFVKENNCKESK